MAAFAEGAAIVSTVLSLVFVPSFYTVMDDLSRLTSWIIGHFVGAADEDDGGEDLEPRPAQGPVRISGKELHSTPPKVPPPGP